MDNIYDSLQCGMCNVFNFLTVNWHLQ